MATIVESFPNAKDPNSPLDIRPLTGRIGAEIRGVVLSGDLDAGTVQAIEAALVRHKVIFFREQQHLDNAEHEAFTALFGDPVAHPTVPVAEGSKYLLELDSREGYAASSWHTDVTFVDAYPKGSILRGITIPEAGGDTLWANGVTAYEELPEPLRQLVNNLWAVHSNDYDYAAVLGANRESQAQQDLVKQHKNVFTSTVYETEHPGGRAQPAAGPFPQALRRAQPGGFPAAVRHPAGSHHQAGKHRALALAGGRRRLLGQPRHPASRSGGLRAPAPHAAPGDGPWRSAGGHRRANQPHHPPGKGARVRARLTRGFGAWAAGPGAWPPPSRSKGSNRG